MLQFGAPSADTSLDDGVTEPIDRSMLAKLDAVIDDATAAFEAFDYARALERTEAFFWWFCDNYVELVKGRTYDEPRPEAADSAKRALREALGTIQRLFAPILPFATEEAWSWWNDSSVHSAPWPTPAGTGSASVRRPDARRRGDRGAHAGASRQDRSEAQPASRGRARSWSPRRGTARSASMPDVPTSSTPARSATCRSSTATGVRPWSRSPTTTDASTDTTPSLPGEPSAPYTRRCASEVGSAGDRGRLPPGDRRAGARRPSPLAGSATTTDDTTTHDRRDTSTTLPGGTCARCLDRRTPRSGTLPRRSSVRPPRRAGPPPAARRCNSRHLRPSPFDPPADGGNGGARRVLEVATDRVGLRREQHDRSRCTGCRASRTPNDPTPGVYRVWSRSIRTFSINNPSITWGHMVRFAKGDRGGNIGFHDIPYQYGRPVQTTDQLGQALSGGCVRQAYEDAVWMWNWAQLGTVVVVTP